MTARTEELAARWSAVMMSNYKTPPVALDARRGRHGLGRRRPRVHRPARRHRDDDPRPRAPEGRRGDHRRRRTSSGHVSNLAMHEPGLLLAERLLDLAGRPGRVFFCNSGAEANETAFKISRLTGRPEVITAEGAFHGRTMGALALTGQPSKAAAFAPLPGGVRYVPYGDADALAAAVVGADRDGAARADARARAACCPRPPATWPAAASAAADAGALFAVDEVQTGIGRTGAWFMHQADGLAARRHHPGQGAGRRAADGRAAGLRRGGRPADRRARTARRSAATRSPPRPRWRCSTPSATRGCSSGPRSSSTGSPPASRASATPASAGVRGRGALLGVVLTADVAARAGDAACAPRASSPTPSRPACSGSPRRSCSPTRRSTPSSPPCPPPSTAGRHPGDRQLT